MMKLLFVFLLAGCSSQAFSKSPSPDAGVAVPQKSQVYIENKARWVLARYYGKAVQLCYAHTYSDECPAKAKKDFMKILEFMVRSVNNGTEDQFDETMESWYGQNVKP